MTMPTPPAPEPTSPPADPGQPPAAPPAPPQAPAPVPQPPTWTPPQPAQTDDGEDLAKLPQKWQKHIKDLREESAKYRTSARSETVLRHAYTTAAAHGVNPDALLGSTVFAGAASNLDPSAEDFPARLAEAIQAALAANPWMAQQSAPAAPPPPPAPPQSGGDFTGGSGTGQPPTSLQDQIREAESKGDWKTARHLKTQLMLHQSQ